MGIIGTGGRGSSFARQLDKRSEVADSSKVKGEQNPSSSLIDGIFSVAIGEAAERSWRQHRMVEISEILAPFFNRAKSSKTGT